MRSASESASSGAYPQQLASDFEVAYDPLARAGFTLEPADQAWLAFEAARATYASRPEDMATC
jgi:hypothetical protein